MPEPSLRKKQSDDLRFRCQACKNERNQGTWRASAKEYDSHHAAFLAHYREYHV